MLRSITLAFSEHSFDAELVAETSRFNWVAWLSDMCAVKNAITRLLADPSEKLRAEAVMVDVPTAVGANLGYYSSWLTL